MPKVQNTDYRLWIRDLFYNLQSTFNNLSTKGFSLIELLVAIAIIAVVFSVIISSAGALQANSRNAQRQTDLRSIQSALQHYYADQHFFPSIGFVPSTDTNGLTSCDSNGGSCNSSTEKTYLITIPQDPVPGTTTPYCYKPYSSLTAYNNGVSPDCDNSATSKCHYYVLCAKLENKSGATCTACGGSYNLNTSPL